jgi:hypothetical protein
MQRPKAEGRRSGTGRAFAGVRRRSRVWALAVTASMLAVGVSWYAAEDGPPGASQSEKTRARAALSSKPSAAPPAAVRFSLPTYLDASTDPGEIAMADFNGDSLVDIATANFSRTVSVLLAVGGGRFRAARVYPAGGGVRRSIAVGDLSGDGGPDIAVANTTRDAVSVFISNPDGSLRPVVHYRTGGGPTSVAIGDLNADARADLAVVNWDDVTLSTLLGR